MCGLFGIRSSERDVARREHDVAIALQLRLDQAGKLSG